MKELSIAIITNMNHRIQEYGIHRCVELPEFQILLMAYQVDQNEIQVIDFMNNEYIPPCICQAIRDYDIPKYTFGFEYERLSLYKKLAINQCMGDDAWVSSSLIAKYFGISCKLESLCDALGITLFEEESVEYCRNFLSHFTSVHANKFNEYSKKFPNTWNRLKNYCKWMIFAEKQVRKELSSNIKDKDNIFSVYKKIAKKGIQIDLQKLEKELRKNAEIGMHISSRYNFVTSNLNTCMNTKNYYQFLRMNYVFQNFLKFEYRILWWRLNSENLFYDINDFVFDLNIPKMLLRTAESENGKTLYYTEYRNLQYNILCWLAGCPVKNKQFSRKLTEACMYGEKKQFLIEQNILNTYSSKKIQSYMDLWAVSNIGISKFWDELWRGIFFVLTFDAGIIVRKLKLEKKNNHLWIQLPSGRRIVYLNARLVNDTKKTIQQKEFDSEGKWTMINCHLSTLLKDIVKYIINDLVLHISAQAQKADIEVVSMGKMEILVNLDSSGYVIWDILKTYLPDWAKDLQINREYT